MAETRKMSRSGNDGEGVQARAGLQKFRAALKRIGPIAFIAFGLTTLITVGVIAAAVFPRGAVQDASGTWPGLLTERDARYVVALNYDAAARHVSLAVREDALRRVLTRPREQRFVRAHVQRFNRAFSGGRAYRENRVPGDCMFLVTWNEDGSPRLDLRELSAYNQYPRSDLKARQFGSIVMRPSEQPIPYLSDGEVGMFLRPGSDHTLQVPLDGPGLYAAGRLELLDAGGQVRGVLRSDGEQVLLSSGSGNAVFLDNNPPWDEEVNLAEGQIAEIGGRFFEARIREGGLLAGDAGRFRKRLYPLGSGFHIVGPGSPGVGHFPLGLEALFSEYLEGNPDKEIPPGKIWLTIDPLLQSELSHNLARLVEKSEAGIVSGLIMDAQTGALRAMSAFPEPYDPGDGGEVRKLLESGGGRYANHGCFKRHVIGSVTKPFFALAGLVAYEDLERLHVSLSSTATPTIFGHRLYGSREARLRVKTTRPAFKNYIVNSNNAYQHSLGFLLMAGVEDLNDIPSPWLQKGGGKLTLRSDLDHDPLVIGTLGARGGRDLIVPRDNPTAVRFRAWFDLETQPAQGVVNDRDLGIFGALVGTMRKHLELRYDFLEDSEETLKARTAVCAPEFPRLEMESVVNTMDVSNLLYGANRNHWTDVKLCESFSRLVTGKKVEARLIEQFLDTLNPDENGAYPLVNLDQPAGDFPVETQFPSLAVRRPLLDLLRRVPTEGTAVEVKPALLEIREDGYPQFTLFAKTGTIDDGSGSDSKLLLGTFGSWNGRAFDGPAYTFVIYLKNAAVETAINDLVAEVLPRWWRLLNSQQELAETENQPFRPNRDAGR